MDASIFWLHFLCYGFVWAGEWTEWNNHQYFLAEFKERIIEAKRFCHTNNAELTSIVTEEELAFLTALFPVTSRDLDAWIGLEKKTVYDCSFPVEVCGEASRWQWLDGNDVTFTHWDSGEPGSLDKFVILKDTGLWHGIDGGTIPWNQRHFICKRVTNSTSTVSPVPTTTRQRATTRVTRRNTRVTSSMTSSSSSASTTSAWSSSSPSTEAKSRTSTTVTGLVTSSKSSASTTSPMSTNSTTTLGSWVAWNNHQYFLSDSSATSTSAQESCHVYNAELTSVLSEEEKHFLALQMFRTSITHSWIGLEKISDDICSVECGASSKWKWLDGSSVDFTLWSLGQPDEIVKCVYMSAETGSWHDISCQDSLHFICKRTSDATAASKQNQEEKSTSSAVVVAGAIGGCLVLIIIAVVIIVLAIWRMRGAKGERRTRAEGQRSNFNEPNYYNATAAKTERDLKSNTAYGINTRNSIAVTNETDDGCYEHLDQAITSN